MEPKNHVKVWEPDLGRRAALKLTMRSSIATLILSLTMVVAQVQPSLFGEGSSGIDVTREYASGSIPAGTPSIEFWYAWINYQSTKLIFLSLQSSIYNSPVHAFIGQEFNTTSGEPIFVGSPLQFMEVFEDANQNGMLDANYTLQTSELKYFFMVNSSLTFTPTHIEKTQNENTTHYRWGVRYGGIDGFLLYPMEPPNCGGGTLASQVQIESLSLYYDFSVEQNVTYLKTTYELGELTLQSPEPDVTLQGLSLSLLYATVTLSPTEYAVVAGGQSFNSSQSSNPTRLVTAAELRVSNATAFEFRFSDNYTLAVDPPVSYPARYAAVPSDAVSPNFFCGGVESVGLYQMQYFLEDLLPEIGQPLSSLSLNYTSSSLIYRIAYPTWSGHALEHDPTYVAYLNPAAVAPPAGPPNGPPPPGGSSFPIELTALAAFASIVAVIVVIRRLRGLGQRTKPPT